MFKFLVLIFCMLVTLVYSRNTHSRVKRIINGTPSELNEFPYSVSLQVLSDSKYKHFCGGTIIGNGWILTASHCLFKESFEDIFVFVGGNDLTNSTTENRFRVEKIFKKAYDRYTLKDDIALIKIKLNEKDSIPIISLPQNDKYIPEGSCVIVGYGAPHYGGEVISHLNYALVDVLTYDECLIKLGRILTPEPHFGMFCAGDGVMDACQGDSGGAIICKNSNNENILAGIISYGAAGCGNKGIPGVYTSVSHHLNWILNYIKT